MDVDFLWEYTMTDFRTIFEQAYPGKDSIYEKIILPIFKNATDLRKTPAIARWQKLIQRSFCKL